MSQRLVLHPDSRCDAVTQIEVDVTRDAGAGFHLRYAVTGSIDDLRIPNITESACADGLWQHTCFEAFVRAGSAPAYNELNFAPSTLWAVYRFKAYRQRLPVTAEITPRIGVKRADAVFTLEASLTLSAMSELSADAVWRIGLSAVIEEAGGRLSYWALAHPPGKPDFHHSDCFTLTLGPASRA